MADVDATGSRAATEPDVKVPYKLAQRIRLALDHAHRGVDPDDHSYRQLADELIECEDYPLDHEVWS